MAKQAVGLLETRGLACLVVGVDAMLKSANVELVGPMKQVGSALCNAVVSGDVAAVKAALDAGAAAAAQSGEVVSAHVIARPDDAIDGVITKSASAPARAARK
ncbi:MAG: BMC domain-containing protein [Akkermansiaceae bacterium]|jgi:ethanolamine utilization protein EutM|nr:BMC domain-containing protein [Akkermansiaceae bacterium]MDP4647443.1 BMC domain-containing protein [Akkermansiaceae bacterium]MDP4721701.1 BMC domain-containing protein [Akkermansiaceae bacterium]MDP4781588.1 BMC domain-containing protein [Akkermansiaceae bacterium]MDP4848049.1 BMC domain-containing protein [Akkermansiaceae bacterium]